MDEAPALVLGHPCVADAGLLAERLAGDADQRGGLLPDVAAGRGARKFG